MINKNKLIELSTRFPKDVVLYNQDIKTLMKLPGRFPGEFDKQLLEFLKITNGAHIMDYRFYGFKNLQFTPSLDQNFMDKWYEWQYIAGDVIPFIGSSASYAFGYLCKIPFNGSHPIVYFTEFPEDTTLIASGFDAFFNIFLDYVELSLVKGDDIEIDIDDWPFDINKLIEKDPLLLELYESEKVMEVVNSLKRYSNN